MKLVWETRKIMGDSDIQVNPTAVRVPVFFGHSEPCTLKRTKKSAPRRSALYSRRAPGIQVIDRHEDGGYPTAVTDGANADAVFVGRIREDISHPAGSTSGWSRTTSAKAPR